MKKERRFIKENIRRYLSAVMVAIMCFNIVLPAAATEVSPETVWNGDGLSVDVKAGKDGYTFLSVFRSPAHAYEISNHVTNDGTGNAIPQTLVLVDADRDYTWTPDGPYSYGSSNYDVLYCCDAITGYNDGFYYKRMNLEDCDYYDEESAAHIRAIVTNSYPYISMEEMKENLAKDGFEGAEDLTRADIIAGVQTAIWYFANSSSDFRYVRSYNVAATPGYGKVMHDFTAEMSEAIQKLGNKKTLVDAEAGARTDALSDYLKSMGTLYADPDQIVITKLEIINMEAIGTTPEDGSFLATVRVALNSGGSSEDDSIRLDIYVDDELVETRDVHMDSSVYDVTVSAKVNQTVKAVVSGKQALARGVYFYEPEGGRDVSQCLVGVGFGETSVYAETKLTIDEEPEIPETEISGAKTWDDNDNQDGKRPESITINLLANGEKVDSKVVTEADGWAWSFTELDMYKDGEKIEYSVSEEAVEGYAAEIEGYDITNVHIPETTEVSGFKTWDDDENRDGVRPESVTIRLYADGNEIDFLTVTEADEWKWSFTGLDKYKAGVEIVYTISEDAVDGYTTNVEGYNVTNTHAPAKVEVSGAKTWDDNDNQDGKRPASITINLLANGEKVDSKVVTAADGWAWTFANLDKYEAGIEIVYTITEDAVAEYTTEINGNDVINTHEIEKVEVSGAKTWEDNNNQDGKRPASITINLLANGEKVDSKVVTEADGWAWTFANLDKYEAGVEIVYTITEDAVAEYTTEINGNDVINTHEIEKVEVSGAKTWDDNDNQDGKRPASITINLLANGEKVDSKVVTEADGWAWTFANLDKYEAGAEITYTITEDEVAEYTTTINGYNVTNTHAPGKVNVNGTKIWMDNNNQDGKRPASITINLLANGEKVDSKVVTEADGWAWTFANLDKYEAGVEIVYTITEDAVAEYTTKVDGYNVINTHEIEKVEVSGTKTWEDNNNQDGKRPASITINLLANGEKVDSKVVTAADGWAWTFANLDKYEAGVEITYTITEDEVAEYTTTINGYNVTNTHAPGKVNVNGTKIWMDNNNQDGKRPASITVNLLANGEKVDSKVVTEADGWAWTFANLDKYEAGVEIVYTVTEDAVAEYTTKVDGYNVINTHEIEKVEVPGEKIWIDNDYEEGTRPSKITIRLYADGVEVDSKAVTAADAWRWTFTNLDKYNNGEEIVYTISEDAVHGYTTEIDGYNVINTYETEEPETEEPETEEPETEEPETEEPETEEPETEEPETEEPETEEPETEVPETEAPETEEQRAVPVMKVWEDGDDEAGMRPEFVTIQLYANGAYTGKTVTLNGGNGWTAEFEELPVYDETGAEIAYTVMEVEVESYVAEITGNAEVGFVITNLYTEEILEDPVPLAPQGPQAPQTGDNTWILMLTTILSAGAVVAVVAIPKKKEEEEA